uniref:Uncharacterized protein n=1 Tax=Oryza meridionalis TaxID=40149 RepID=A0A0E0DC07_9ORYZ
MGSSRATTAAVGGQPRSAGPTASLASILPPPPFVDPLCRRRSARSVDGEDHRRKSSSPVQPRASTV